MNILLYYIIINESGNKATKIYISNFNQNHIKFQHEIMSIQSYKYSFNVNEINDFLPPL